MSGYAFWNDTSVAHMFIRLITKKNHPYNDAKLPYEIYKTDYDNLKGYIEWDRNVTWILDNVGFLFGLNSTKFNSMYNFTHTNMVEIFDELDYLADNEEHLMHLWMTKIMNR